MPVLPALPPPCCGTAQRRQIIAAAQALGVPADYGRSRALSVVREPTQLRSIGRDIHAREQWLTPPAARAWRRMRAQAALDGVELQVVSAFRSAEYQLGIVQRKLERGLSMDAILQVSAAPGFSEHHSGRALDLTTPGYAALEEEFEHSPAFAWLVSNAADFGFTLSYPRGNPHKISYEPWHWCWRRTPRSSLTVAR
ncbi:MAG: M15 family metallopeptidase [Dokdonella sp.]